MSYLINKDLEKIIPPLYSQEHNDNPIAYARFYVPFTSWQWYILEYSKEESILYGLVYGFEKEYGYISLEELELVQALRDDTFVPTNIKDVICI